MKTCSRCKKEHAEETNLCLECKVWFRNKKQERLNQGMCAKCPRSRAESGMLCQTCRERRNTRQRSPEFRAYRQARRPKYKEQEKDYRLRSRFGITLAEHTDLLTKQGGLCAGCGNPPCEKLLHVDHDHTTGKVRELLCNDCNLTLGFARESVERLHGLISYLKRHA